MSQSYTMEPIAQAPVQNSTGMPVFRPDLVVDHKSDRPVRKPQTEQVSTSKEGSPDTVKPTTSEVPEMTLTPAAAALARKEQKFRQQQADLKAQQEALETERKEIADLKALKAKLASKDFSDLEKLAPYDEYTNYLIEKSGGASPEREQIKSLETKLTELEKAQKADIDKRFEAAVAQRRSAVEALVESNPDFSSIKELKATEHVVKHILDTWEEDGVDLSPDQAAKEVEEVLLEQANKWAGLSKLKKALPPMAEEKPKAAMPAKPATKTLTNNMAATGDIKTVRRNYANMSEHERWKAARETVLAELERNKKG